MTNSIKINNEVIDAACRAFYDSEHDIGALLHAIRAAIAKDREGDARVDKPIIAHRRAMRCTEG